MGELRIPRQLAEAAGIRDGETLNIFRDRERIAILVGGEDRLDRIILHRMAPELFPHEDDDDKWLELKRKSDASTD